MPAWALAFGNAIENEEERLQCLVGFDGEEGVKQVVLHWQRQLGIFLTPQALREGIRKDLNIKKLSTQGRSGHLYLLLIGTIDLLRETILHCLCVNIIISSPNQLSTPRGCHAPEERHD